MLIFEVLLLSHLEYRRLDALADLIPDINMSRHLGQHIGPDRGLLASWSGPVEVRRVSDGLIQLR